MVHLLLAVIYLSFISLGLPDSVLGAAWPSMYQGFGVPLSYAGAVSMIVALGTIISSLLSDRLTRRLGTGLVTALSTAMTAAALYGFSTCRSFPALCLWAVPYGLGAGSVDASINNYVALHYASRHMSWLHCMWGVGASVGPWIMGLALTHSLGWGAGYRIIGALQLGLTAILFLSLPLWKKRTVSGGDGAAGRALTLREVTAVPGVREVMAAFFCYCAVEQTAGLWAASYMVLHYGLTADEAASFGSLFFLGITAGRGVCGFLTMRLSDKQMVRLGESIILAGVLVLLLPLGQSAAPVGLILVGAGCAPIYPSLIHATPEHFGAERSQAVIGVQMAAAYVGTCLMPPLFGLLAQRLGAGLLPFYLLALLLLMAALHEALLRKVQNERSEGHL